MKFDVSNIERPHCIDFLDDSQYVAQTNCPICGGSHTDIASVVRTSRQMGLQLNVCRDCEHIFFARRPNDAWYEKYYRSKSDFRRDISKKSADRIRKVIRELPLVRNWWTHRLQRRHFRGAIIKSMLHGIATSDNSWYRAQPEIKTVLEVGCGLGGTLQLYRSFGLSALGVEATPERAAICRDKGLNVIDVPISDLSMVAPLGPFDLIASSHVLEHVIDIDDHLAQLTELSRQDGYLYIEVPNVPTEHIFHRAHTPAHVHVFSLRSLERLLARRGFVIVRVLQDISTHVLARRSDVVAPYITYNGTLSLACFERGIPQLTSAAGQLVRYSYFNDCTEIRSLETDQLLFRHKTGFRFRDQRPDEIMFIEGRLSREANSGHLPIEFVHQGDKAPIFC